MIREQIYSKIIEMQEKPRYIRKVFNFSMEDLHDRPETCLKEIESYLEQHSDKIHDFYFDTFIEEESFKPILIMHIDPVKNIREMLVKNSIWDKLVPPGFQMKFDVRSRVQKVLEKYLFEINSKETRRRIMNDLESMFASMNNQVTLEDGTTSSEANNGTLSFFVIKNNERMSLEEFINSLES